MKKIAFFDIDGTLTSEIDGSIPQSAITAIRKARANGNLMFLNTGRCIQNVEPRFQEVGFDGFVCGCGTDIYCGGKNLLHVTQSHEITMELLKAARDTNVDIVFESSTAVAYDPVRPVIHPDAVAQYDAFVKRGYKIVSGGTDGDWALLAREVFVDPEKLPLAIVADRSLHAVYAASGYNVGLAAMLAKIANLA